MFSLILNSQSPKSLCLVKTISYGQNDLWTKHKKSGLETWYFDAVNSFSERYILWYVVQFAQLIGK